MNTTSPESVALLGHILMSGAYLSILTHYCGPKVADWVRRKRRRIASRKKVVVLKDKERHSRTCFWKQMVEEHTELRIRTKFEFQSIGDEIEKGNNPATMLFDPKRCDVIVCNWDSLNGDPVYDSRRSFEFLAHYRSDFRAWLEGGGVVILESQGASWDPIAEPYTLFDTLVGGSCLTVHELEGRATRKLYVDPSAEVLPLMGGLTNDSDLCTRKDSLGELKPWFPLSKGETRSITASNKKNRRLARGYFSETGHWNVLLRNDDGKPVMIYRRASDAPGSGIIFLTTLFIASSSLDKLAYMLIAELPGNIDELVPTIASKCREVALQESLLSEANTDP